MGCVTSTVIKILFQVARDEKRWIYIDATNAILHASHAISHLSHATHATNAISHATKRYGMCTYDMKLLDMTVLLSENSMGIYPAGLKVNPDVFLHDICELIFCQPVFFRFRTKNEKQDSLRLRESFVTFVTLLARQVKLPS